MWGSNTCSRSAPNPVDMWRSNMPNALRRGNSSTTMQVNATGIQTGNFQGVANRLECPVSSDMQKPFQRPISPLRFSQMSLQNSLPIQGSPHFSRQIESQLHTPSHLNQTSNTSIEQHHDHKSPQSCGDVGTHSLKSISEPVSCALSRSGLSEDLIGCDCSEHICPDGNKYYFNSTTCESRWEEPEEFASYEQQLRKPLLNQKCQESCPLTLETSSIEEDCQIQVTQDQRESFDCEKTQLAVSRALEHTHEQIQAENSALGGPAFVQ